MLYAQLLKRLCGGLGAPGLHVLMTLPDTFNGLLEVMLLPFQILGQSIVERGGGVLPATLRVLFKLGLALRLDRYYIHDAFRVGTAGTTVKPRVGCFILESCPSVLKYVCDPPIQVASEMRVDRAVRLTIRALGLKSHTGVCDFHQLQMPAIPLPCC